MTDTSIEIIKLVWITLTSAFLLYSLSLLRRSKKELSSLFTLLEDGLDRIETRQECVNQRLQNLELDMKEYFIRTSILETRFEERTFSMYNYNPTQPKAISQVSPKRGRPRKNREE